MLEDTPRKLLLIMTHYARHFGGLPGLPELERLSGRTAAAIKEGLLELVRHNYIEWNPHLPPERATVIEGWERDNPAHKSYQTGPGKQQGAGETGNIDYWTHY